MSDKGRRKFLSSFFQKETIDCLRGFSKGLREAKQNHDFEKFFESDESSYSLTLAYPDEILIETAKKYGIEVENRPRREIVKELLKQREDY